MMTRADRQTEFVLTFLSHDPAQIGALIETPNLELKPHRSGGTIAIIGSRKMSGAAVDLLLDQLWQESAPLLTRLSSEGVAPDAALLRVVQYIAPIDDIGAGFAIEQEWLRTLAEFNGVVDIDLYVREERSTARLSDI